MKKSQEEEINKSLQDKIDLFSGDIHIINSLKLIDCIKVEDLLTKTLNAIKKRKVIYYYYFFLNLLLIN